MVSLVDKIPLPSDPIGISGVPGHRHLSGFRGCLRTHLQRSQVPWSMDLGRGASSREPAGLMLVKKNSGEHGRYNELDELVFMRFFWTNFFVI